MDYLPDVISKLIFWIYTSFSVGLDEICAIRHRRLPSLELCDEGQRFARATIAEQYEVYPFATEWEAVFEEGQVMQSGHRPKQIGQIAEGAFPCSNLFEVWLFEIGPAKVLLKLPTERVPIVRLSD